MTAARRATIKDVAGVAGVGVATVSRVLSGTGSASPEMRERVLEAARRLDYRPSALGRNLKLRRSGGIGLLLPDITDTFHARLTDGVLAAARSHGRHVLLDTTGDDPEREAERVEALTEQRVDGIIAIPAGDGGAYAGTGPTVFVDRMPRRDVPAVLPDDRSAMRGALDYLAGLGHRRIGFLGREARAEPFRDVMYESGLALDEELLVRVLPGRDNSYAGAAGLFQRRPDITALVAGGNLPGEAAVLAARELDLRVPADVSIVMFDDVPWAELCDPPLTAVTQPAGDMGYRAAELLLGGGRSTRQAGANNPVILPTELVVRASCGPPGGARRR